MKFCEYQPGKFVNPLFIVRVSVSCNERTRFENPFNMEELRQRMEVLLEINGDALPARVEPACLEHVARLVPAVEERMRTLALAVLKANVISALCRFPLAA